MAREYRVITALGPDAGPRARDLSGCARTPRSTGSPSTSWSSSTGTSSATPRRPSATSTTRRGVGPASRWPTPWPPCTPSTSTPSGSGTSPSATGTSSASCAGGTSSSATRRSRDSTPPPIVGAVHDRLAAAVPPQVGTSIVHGDYRLDNTVLGPDGAVRAVLDWEICTLGDPLADVGLLMVYWTDPGDEAALLGVSPRRRCRASPTAPRCGPATRRRRDAISNTSTSTSPSATGSWPASSRASTPATSVAPRRETGPASTTSATAWSGWRRWRSSALDAS